MDFETYIKRSSIASDICKKNYIRIYNNKEQYSGQTLDTVLNLEKCYERFIAKVEEKVTSQEQLTFDEYLDDCTELTALTKERYKHIYKHPQHKERAKLKKHVLGFEYCLSMIKERAKPKTEKPSHCKSSKVLRDTEEVLSSNLRDDLKLQLLKLILGAGDE